MRGPYLAVPRYLGVGTRHLYSRAHACASKIRDIAFRPPSPPPPRRRRTPRFRVTTVHGNEKFPGSRWTPVKYRARPSRRGWKWIVFTERGGGGGSSAEITGAWRFDANVAWCIYLEVFGVMIIVAEIIEMDISRIYSSEWICWSGRKRNRDY